MEINLNHYGVRHCGCGAICPSQEARDSGVFEGCSGTGQSGYVEGIYSAYKIAFDNEQIASTNLAYSPIINVNAFKAPRTVGAFIISSDITEAWRLFEPLTQVENFCSQVATILNLEDATHAADMISFTGYPDEANALNDQINRESVTDTVCLQRY